MALTTAFPDTYERILIYGAPKVGKTRFATSLPARFGNIVYFAVDPGSERLDSVLAPYVSRIHVVQSRPAKVGDVLDSRRDAFLVSQNDWVAQYPAVRTLVWDTLTISSQQILQHISDQGAFSSAGHISMGVKGSKEYQTVPMQGDYGAAQNAVDRIISFLFQQPLHIIIVAHEGYRESMEAGSKTLIGGPLTVGSKTIGSIAGRFPTCIRLTRRTEGSGSTARSRVIAYTETNGIWVAGVRSKHLSNPLPMVDVIGDPLESFWKPYDSTFAAAEQPPTTTESEALRV